MSLRAWMGHGAGTIHGASGSVAMAGLDRRTGLGQPGSLLGKSVLIALRDPAHAALAMIELDGVARRMVLCTPDLGAAQLRAVAARAQADACVVDEGLPDETLLPAVRFDPALPPGTPARQGGSATEWVLLTSGTSGVPKLVTHTLESLAGGLPRERQQGAWSTFYDIRRYGGLQILLRALLGGTDLVVPGVDEPMADFIARAAAARVTHMSGTPSHWRRALMGGLAHRIAPRYVRLSGEIADQPLLDRLAATFPDAGVAHAFASTEAGVAFAVDDGRAGFPAHLLAPGAGAVEMKLEDGTLRIRSPRIAGRYLGEGMPPIADAQGFVDTRDRVVIRDGRCAFVGRQGGVINVGGLKVHPEEVEAVLNADSRVRVSLVKARRNPIVGAVVVADVVLGDALPTDDLKRDLIGACRVALAAHKVPAMLRFVPALEMSAAGKLVRPLA